MCVCMCVLVSKKCNMGVKFYLDRSLNEMGRLQVLRSMA